MIKIIPETGNISSENSVTILVGTTLSGKCLPFQVIYYKQEDDYSLLDFPKNWHITFTPKAKSNTISLLQYLEVILVPYINETKRLLGCPDEQYTILILDKNGPHRSKLFLDNLHNANICEIFVPGAQTKTSQPIDIVGSTSDNLKTELFEKLQIHYNRNNDSQSLSQSVLRLSDMKKKHAHSLVAAYRNIENNPINIIRGWEKSGIEKAVFK